MFDAISPTYDRTNRILSFGTDLLFRKKLSEYLPEKNQLKLLDLATGTADQIIALMDTTDKIDEVTGLDPAQKMLDLGEKKLRDKFYHPKVRLVCGVSENLPFEQHAFDVVTISFGIRNVQSVEKTLSEACRVLKPGGLLMILEFSLPEKRWINYLYLLYLRRLLPLLGGIASGNFSAYRYLNKTIETFPYGEAFLEILQKNGWNHPKRVPLLFGTMQLYLAHSYD